MRTLLFALLITCFGWTDSSKEILNYAFDYLHQSGTLKNQDGFIYVDIDDDYVHKLIAFIQNEGFEEPPYFGRAGLVGAHISAIYVGELADSNIKELGTQIGFSVKKCSVVKPPQWGYEEVYIIEVDAPQLDRLRKKYKLQKPKYGFHITIGVKPARAA